MKKLKHWTKYYLDRNYRKALEEANSTCVICGQKEDIIVHHKDSNRKNNGLENLKVVCRPCHAREHKQHLKWKNPNRELILELRKNGQTYQKIADYLGVSRQRIHQIVAKFSG